MNTTATAVRVGNLYLYASPTGEILVSEVIRIERNGTVVTAESLNTDARRTAAYMDVETVEEFTFVGTVRPTSDRLHHIEDGDLFVFTYEAPDHTGAITGNTFVFEVTHAFILGDPDRVVGFIHFPDAYYDGPGTRAYRFERTHLRDFRYAGKIDNDTRGGKLDMTSTPTTEVPTETAKPPAGTHTSAGTTA